MLLNVNSTMFYCDEAISSTVTVRNDSDTKTQLGQSTVWPIFKPNRACFWIESKNDFTDMNQVASNQNFSAESCSTTVQWYSYRG